MYNHILSEEAANFLLLRETYGGKIPLIAYKLPNDLWTIGIGQTYYSNGQRVKAGDRFPNVEAAKTEFKKFVRQEFTNDLAEYFKNTNLNSVQFGALLSYKYNRGPKAYNTTLFRMVLQNPNNPAIAKQFEIEWGSNQTYKAALIARRKLEADFYFSMPVEKKKKLPELY